MAGVSNVTNQIIAYLCKHIRDGSWSPGSRLPSEHQLCQTLGVSRTSVRSALQQLGALGIVESVRGKGTYLRSSDLSALETVPIQSPERLRHLMEFARLVWPSLCGSLACGIEEDSLLALEQTVKELHTLESGAWKRLIHLVMEFHYALATPFYNPILTELTENFLRELGSYPCVDNWNLVYHGLLYYFDLLLLALRKHEREQASAIMDDYLRHSAEFCYQLSTPSGQEAESAPPEKRS